MKMVKNIIINGANGAVGSALVKHYLNEGWNVAACSRSSGFFLSSILEKYSLNGSFFTLDLTKEIEITACAKNLLKWMPKPDVLVNCAGMPSGNSFVMSGQAELKETFQVNFFGQILFSQYVARRMMRARSGCILNIGSTAGIVADRGTLCYGTSKAALHHATKIMARELGEFGIRVNSIAPGVIESGMSDKMDRISVENHKKRMVSPELISIDDVLNAVNFMTSEGASKFQGHILRLDNGFQL